MNYAALASEIVWIIVAIVGVVATALAFWEALKDQRAMYEAGINGSAERYTREHVNQELRSLIACSVALIGGILRYSIPNELETNGSRIIEMWAATGAVVFVVALLAMASVRRLQLRSQTLATLKAEHVTGMPSRSALMEAIWTTTAILVVDMHSGAILQATRPAEQMFGYHMVGDLRGRPVEDLVPDAQRAAHKGHRKRYAETPKARHMGDAGMVLQGRKRDGTIFPLEIGLCAAIIEGRECVIATVADASKRGLPRGVS